MSMRNPVPTLSTACTPTYTDTGYVNSYRNGNEHTDGKGIAKGKGLWNAEPVWAVSPILHTVARPRRTEQVAP
jgi:hypothetical protein